jgi:glutamyl-tRNA synthetase
MSVKVRFAPSPTGALHIGGVRTALYNYLYAKKNNGIFILRIEDTDQGRFVPGAEAYILETLKWAGIEPDEGQGYSGSDGPYRQSERSSIYRQYAHELIESGQAYYAFDTESELEAMRDRLANEGITAPKYDASVRQLMKNSMSLSVQETQELLKANTRYVIRLKVEPGTHIGFSDLIREEVVFNTSELDDKVLIKADGLPTYHLANVVDDHLMQISHVIRGEEWISSTGHHLLLYKAFGWDHPRFAHLPLILKPDGKGKLSKRDGSAFGIPVFPLSWPGIGDKEGILGFREYGFEPEAMINFLAFLGWNPGTDQEIFNLEELVANFELVKVHKAGARFDMDKARWINQQYVRKMTIEEIEHRLKPLLALKGWHVPKPDLEKIIPLFQDRIHFVKDIIEQAAYFFEEPSQPDHALWAKHLKPALIPQINQFILALSEFPSWVATELESFAKSKLNELNLKPGEVFPIFRLALAGSLQGPTVFQMLEIMQSKGIARIKTRLGL